MTYNSDHTTPLEAQQADKAMEYIKQRQASGEITHLEYAVFLSGSKWAAAELMRLREAAQQDAEAVCNVCGAEIIAHQVGQRAVCSNRDCPTRRP